MFDCPDRMKRCIFASKETTAIKASPSQTMDFKVFIGKFIFSKFPDPNISPAYLCTHQFLFIANSMHLETDETLGGH